jgi:hypothetical protein
MGVSIVMGGTPLKSLDVYFMENPIKISMSGWGYPHGLDTAKWWLKAGLIRWLYDHIMVS